MKITLSRLIGSKLFAVFGLVLLSATAWAGQGAMTIENDRYTVNIEAADGTFTIATKPSGKIVLPAGKLSGTAGTAKSVELDDKNFGKGRGVEVTYADGNRELVALYPNLPFVTFRSTLRNSGAEPVVHKHVTTVSAAIHLGKSMESIQTLGTGGLFPLDKNPGSYAFLSIVDPESRSGVVGGWLTHDRGSGVVFLLLKMARLASKRRSTMAACVSSPAKRPWPRPSRSDTSTTRASDSRPMPTPSAKSMR